MPRLEFLTTKAFDRRAVASKIPLGQLAAVAGLDPSQLSRAIHSRDTFGPRIADRLVALGECLGLERSEILIEIEADR